MLANKIIFFGFSISRGPMREVLVDFLITRFRTDDQIKVIRSNAFLTDLRSRVEDNALGDKAANQDEENIKELKRQLAEIPERKMDIVKQIVKAVGRMNESSKMSMANDVHTMILKKSVSLQLLNANAN